MTKTRIALMGFGASTMQGVGDSQGGFFKRLSARLSAAGTIAGSHNHGIGGNTTNDMLARLEKSAALLPARVIILLGCNDVPRLRDTQAHRRTSLEKYAANLDEIFKALAGPGALFVSSFSVNPMTGVTADSMDPYMAKAMELAGKHGYRTWDLYLESKSWGDRFWASDGIHYNDAGHALLAERIAAMID